MRRLVIPVLAIFALFGLLGFWGDTVQSIVGSLVVLGVVALAIEALFGGK